MSVASPGPNVDEPVMIETTKQPSNDYHEHEELDFEEEFDSDRLEGTKLKPKPECGDNDEEGELSALDEETKQSEKSEKSEIDDDNNKDEGEIDNDTNNDKEKEKTKEAEDLEEGEILSDDEPETSTKDVPKLQFMRGDDSSFNMNNRHYNNRPGGGYRQNRWNSDSNIIPRNRPPLLRNAHPSQYVLRPMPSSNQSDNTWEASCRQAQDIISLATRGGGVDRESNGNGRFDSGARRQRSISPSGRDDIAPKRRRRSPSSEDELERRHRLAFETAPWNSSRGERPPPALGSRNRDDNFPFRDGRDERPYPRRSDPNGEVGLSRADGRRRSRYSPDELHSSSSHSSYESRKFHPNARGTPERRLPYERPSYEERSRYVEKDPLREKSSSSGLPSSGRMDRIPKKYSLNANDGSNPRSKSGASDRSSYDSWSESLSDSSSSYFTDSDNKQIQKQKKKRDKLSKKQKKKDKKEKLESRRHRTLSSDRRSDNERKRSKSISPTAVKKTETKEPIKMQFMKKAGNILQKSSIIREDFISDDELPDFETAEAMIAEKKTTTGDNHHHHHHHHQQQPQDNKNEMIDRLNSNNNDDNDVDDDDDDSNEDAEDFLTEEERRDIEEKLEIINRKIDNKINSHKN